MYAQHFGFKASNNKAAYEVLITGLQLARALGVRNLKAYGDSQFIVRQLQGDYEAREPCMSTYLKVFKRENSMV